MNRTELKTLVRQVIEESGCQEIPIGISNRHIHLSEEDFSCLFPNENVQVLKNLKQPGEFAMAQSVTVIGPKGKVEKVRILGPFRKKTQVELSFTDCRVTGIKAPIRMSGNLDKASDVTLKTKAGEITRASGIIAKRHIHMNLEDASRFGLKNNEEVSVRIKSVERSTVYENVAIRVSPNFVLEMHLDTDEANAAEISCGTVATLYK